ncbi:acyl-coenzyme A diphosphatase FITM2 [Pangasianodon hypophthalmus]|uniref:acyl-coenzyme A diphosphatase FITM2 n=1 Tax=Pangasianodon hypophthalmus TaxID=310915 RepID=UPI000EFF6664|nr:acyl-coenzyme A diphosphatase FITM2 [Pangasianodon hypophthalmus]
MSALSGVVNKSLPFLVFNVTVARKYLPLFFFAVSLGGSLLKELEFVPNSYFSHSRNLLNVYFVKFSWGWNLVLLLPFILLSNSYNRNLIFVSKRLTSLVVATAIWYSCTETFFYIENITGACYESDTLQMVQEDFSIKAECKNAGHFWDGFDISGHSFILSYSTLIIVEEMVPMLNLVQHYQNRSIILDALYLALNAIAIIWVWMFACTSVYFHNTIQKFLGTLFGVLGWCVTYKVWYLNPFSPGLPPRPSDHKQRLD